VRNSTKKYKKTNKQKKTIVTNTPTCVCIVSMVNHTLLKIYFSMVEMNGIFTFGNLLAAFYEETWSWEFFIKKECSPFPCNRIILVWALCVEMKTC